MKKIFTLLMSCMLASAFAQTKQAVNATSMQHQPFTPQNSMRSQTGPLANTFALTGYYTQGFENTTFPPAGWRTENVAGSNVWNRSTAQAHASTASAYIQYQATAAQDWLIMPRFQIASTDSIVFWMRLAYAGYSPDSLSLKVSTTDSLSTSFTTTILSLKEGVNYPTNSTTWYRYAVSLSAYSGQQIFVAFKHYNNNGDGLYIDDIALGTKPSAEVTTTAILVNSTLSASATTPQATFYNNGSVTQTFNVATIITPGGYSSTQTITSLAPAASATATFATWTPTAGTYTVKTFTQLTGDANNTNDTITKTVVVLSSFTNMGWTSKPALPGGRWATAPVFAKPCSSGTDTGFVYLVSGADAAFANSSLTSAYNITSGLWSTKAPIPQSRMQITPIQVNNKIYVIGGYSGSFSPVTTTSIYDITSNTWTTGAAMPAAVGDYASGVYNDSLIYIIGGYNGSGDVNTVQIYNINTNTWAIGTAKTGTASAGLRGAISGNNIVIAGGYSQTLAATQSSAVLGVIDPANPLSITWTNLPSYPAGPSGRLAAGVAAQNNGLVYFGGGDPNGQGTSAINNVYAYNTNLSQWETGPAMLTGASNISGFASVIENDTLYLVTMGGYNGTAVTAANEWLKIGPATIPAVQAGASICAGSSTMLSASNGTAYSWSPAASLDNAIIAMPTATPTGTTTYTVNISTKYGCPVSKTVTVTVNQLPVADAGADASICAGSDTTLGANGGTSYSWAPAAGLDFTNIANPVASPFGTTTYTVTVTDANGCVNTDDVTVNVNLLPTADAGSAASICAGENITLAGSGSGSYSWTPAASLDDNTLAGPLATPTITTTYTLTVTDLNNCMNTSTVVVTVNDLPAPALISSSNISCNGLTDGSAGVSVTGGSTYSYLWSNAETTSTVSGLPAGIISVTITDDLTGCESQGSFTIVEPSPISLLTMDDTTAGCDASVMVMAMGGTPGYTYLWNDPALQTSDMPMNLCSGTYTVQVTDANGCTATATANVQSSVSVSENEEDNLNIYPNPADNNLFVKANFSSSTNISIVNILGEEVIAVSSNTKGSFSQTIDISTLSAGVYYLRIKNENKIASKKIVKK
ncbi:MAG: hypothetical protein K0Q95_1513 [Bacteroidota bacterium]|jgi:N-acetylneuraminic acid mutarotase|nr:hypothetical protein [Bacteroidota bacterium]